MYDQILDLVKNQLGTDPQVAEAIPPGQTEAVHQEVAHQLTQGLASQSQMPGGIGGLLSMLQGGLTSGNPIGSAIEGSVVSSLGSKFGLSPAITGAIAAALPALLQKFAHKANDPNDNSISIDSITKSLSGLTGGGGGLGGLFNRSL